MVINSLRSAFALAVLSALVAVAFLGTRSASADTIYEVIQDGTVVTVTPLTGSETAAAFYDYRSSDASSHTGFEESGKSLLFLYEDSTTGAVALIITHDAVNDGSGGRVTGSITGVDSTASLISSDDPGEFTVNPAAGTASGNWTWVACCTDGGAMNLGTNDVDITISMNFISGIGEWVLFVGNGERVTLDMTKPVQLRSTGVDSDLDGDGFDTDEVLGGTDCDDGDASIHPGATEEDDGVDNDCDGDVDEGLDADGDGFTPIAGGDCDDSNAAVHPGADEVSDGVDNDCDGVVTKGDVLIASGVDGAGIPNAPGLDKPFNPGSAAPGNAGKKK